MEFDGNVTFRDSKFASSGMKIDKLRKTQRREENGGKNDKRKEKNGGTRKEKNRKGMKKRDGERRITVWELLPRKVVDKGEWVPGKKSHLPTCLEVVHRNVSLCIITLPRAILPRKGEGRKNKETRMCRDEKIERDNNV